MYEEGYIMEKVLWVRSNERTLVAKEDDGLDIVNKTV